MSRRNLIIVAAVLIVLAVASQWWNNTGNSAVDDNIGKPLLAPEMVEAFDELILEDSNGVLRIKKSGDVWGIPEKDGYPADMKKLFGLVEELTRHKLASLITKDEKRLDYFKVVYRNSEGGKDENSGSQLTLKKDGTVVFKMMAGKQRQAKSDRPDMPSYPDGQYVRIGDDKSIYLIKQNLLLESDPKEWIKTTLLKTDKKEVKSIRITSKNGDVLLARAEKGKDLELKGLKESEKLDDYERSSLLSELEDFQIDDIIAISMLPESELETKARVTVEVYDKAPLKFRILSKLIEDPLEPDKKEEDKEYSYFLEFDQPNEPSSKEDWKDIFALGENWRLKLEEWKAKRWIKTREDFLNKSSQ